MNSADYFDSQDLLADLGQRALRGGAVTVLAQGGGFVLTTISTVVLARLLTPQDFGLVAMVAPLLVFMGFFRDLGLSTATVQQAEINHAQVSTLFWVNVALSAGLMLLAFALSPLVGIFYRRPEVVWLTVAYGVNCFLTGLSIQHTALLQRRMSFGILASVNLASGAIGIVVGILAAGRGFGFWALAMMSLSSSLASLLAVWWFCSWRPGRPVRGSGVRPMLWFGGFLTGGNLAYFLASNLYTLAIGRWLGAVPLGNYNRANQIFFVSLQQLSSPLAAVAVPALSRLQREPDRYRAAFLQAVQALGLGTVPLACALIAGGDAVALLLLGEKWGVAAKLVRILAVAGLLMPVSGAVSWLLITQGRGKTLMHWSVASVFITLAVVAIGLHWGLVGIAVGMAANSAGSFFIFTFIACAQGPVKVRHVLATIRLPLFAGLSGLLSALLLREMFLVNLTPVHQGLWAILTVVTVSLLLLLVPQPNRKTVLETASLFKRMIGGSVSTETYARLFSSPDIYPFDPEQDSRIGYIFINLSCHLQNRFGHLWRFPLALKTYLLITFFGGTNRSRWSKVSNLDEDWDSRTVAMAKLIPTHASVLEFGAGRRVLERCLPAGSKYTPSDLVSRGHDTLVCDLNAEQLPQFPPHDVAVFSGVLEYVSDVPRLVEALSKTVNFVIASYVPCEAKFDVLGRRALGWVNDYSTAELEKMFAAAGFCVETRQVWRDQQIWKFTVAARER